MRPSTPLDRSVPPRIHEPQQLALMQPRRLTLSNGIPLGVLHAPEAEVVRVDFLFQGGFYHQDKPLQANFTNRMLREGTRRFTAAAVAEELDFYGAWLECSCSPLHSLLTLYSLRKYLPQTLEVVASLLHEPLFPEQELEVMREKELNHFRVMQRQPHAVAHRILKRTLFGEGHPLSHQLTEADYLHLTADDLRAFFRRHYHTAGCSIWLSGCADEGVVSCVDRLFGHDAWGGALPEPWCASDEAVPASSARWFEPMDEASTAVLCMGQFVMPHHHPDYIPFRVLVTLLGGYFGSRLMTTVREQRGLCYSISSALVAYPHCGVLVCDTQTHPSHAEAVSEAVRQEMERLQQEPVGPDELAMLKQFMLGELFRSYESVFSVADAWISLQLMGLDAGYFEASLRGIREATPEQLLTLARRYFCKEKLKEVVVGPKNVTNPKE